MSIAGEFWESGWADDESADVDLPEGYRWATGDETEEIGQDPSIPHLVVTRTFDSQGNEYTDGEADVAVPVSRCAICLRTEDEVDGDLSGSGDELLFCEDCDLPRDEGYLAAGDGSAQTYFVENAL